jgi:hypothetical protein
MASANKRSVPASKGAKPSKTKAKPQLTRYRALTENTEGALGSEGDKTGSSPETAEEFRAAVRRAKKKETSLVLIVKRHRTVCSLLTINPPPGLEVFEFSYDAPKADQASGALDKILRPAGVRSLPWTAVNATGLAGLVKK